MVSLSALPHSLIQWSPNVITAVQTLQGCLYAASSMLHSHDLEAQRIHHHIDLVIDTAYPLLETLEEVADEEGIPIEWITESARKFSTLLLQLLDARDVAQGR